MIFQWILYSSILPGIGARWTSNGPALAKRQAGGQTSPEHQEKRGNHRSTPSPRHDSPRHVPTDYDDKMMFNDKDRSYLKRPHQYLPPEHQPNRPGNKVEKLKQQNVKHSALSLVQSHGPYNAERALTRAQKSARLLLLKQQLRRDRLMDEALHRAR